MQDVHSPLHPMRVDAEMVLWRTTALHRVSSARSLTIAGEAMGALFALDRVATRLGRRFKEPARSTLKLRGWRIDGRGVSPRLIGWRIDGRGASLSLIGSRIDRRAASLSLIGSRIEGRGVSLRLHRCSHEPDGGIPEGQSLAHPRNGPTSEFQGNVGRIARTMGVGSETSISCTASAPVTSW